MDVASLFAAALGVTEAANNFKTGKQDAKAALRSVEKALKTAVSRDMAKGGGPRGFRGNKSGAGSNGPAKHDVVTRMPAATSITTTNVAPRYVNKDNGVTVRGRDLVTTVTGNADFALNSYAVNPGQFRLFPVLSDRAKNYEQYRVKNLTFEWIPLSGTDRSGSVYLCFNPEATTSDPRNEQTLSAMSGSVCGAVYGVGTKVSVKNSGGKILYVRSNIRNDGEDLRTTDFGRFYVAVTDCSTTSALGKLYVNYEIELTYPRSGASNPMVATCFGATNMGNFFDHIYNGGTDTLHDSKYPVSGPDLAYFNSSSDLHWIYFRKPGTYIAILTCGRTPGGQRPWTWDAISSDSTIIESHSASGSSVNVCMWWVCVQVDKPNGYIRSSAANTDALTSQPHIVIFEVGDRTNEHLRIH